MCVIVLLSLGTIAAWRLLSRVRTLSCHLVYLLGLVFIFSPSLAFTFLLLLFLHALAFIFSVTRSFSLPEFSCFHSGTSSWRMGCAPRWSCGAQPSLAVRSRGALLRRLGLRRCACGSKLFYGRSCTPLPTPIISLIRSKCTGALRCSRSLTLLLVGRTGW